MLPVEGYFDRSIKIKLTGADKTRAPYLNEKILNGFRDSSRRAEIRKKDSIGDRIITNFIVFGVEGTEPINHLLDIFKPGQIQLDLLYDGSLGEVTVRKIDDPPKVIDTETDRANS